VKKPEANFKAHFDWIILFCFGLLSKLRHNCKVNQFLDYPHKASLLGQFFFALSGLKVFSMKMVGWQDF